MLEQLIECPECGAEFPVSEALSERIEARLQIKYDEDTKLLRAELAESFKGQLEEKIEETKVIEREAVKKENASEIASLTKALQSAEKREVKLQVEFDKRLAKEKQDLLVMAREEAKQESADTLKKLRRQVREGKKEIEELLEREDQISKKEASLTRKEKSLQRKIDTAIAKAKEEATELVLKDSRLKELEHQKIVSDLNKQLDEAKQKISQRSQELQGEVLELEIERVLQEQFPQDIITPVKKGTRGADINHEVMDPSGNVAGVIIWETKNTKNWAKSWIGKLKSDQRKSNANIAVIVSKALPSGMKSRFEFVDGVWVCDFSVVVGLAVALRMNILDASRLKQSTHGKEEKMEVLYQYLMSTEFKQRVETMVEAFIAMKADLEKERAAMERAWAKREGQINQVVSNIAGMVGDIHAIAPSFPRIERLQLPRPN